MDTASIPIVPSTTCSSISKYPVGLDKTYQDMDTDQHAQKPETSYTHPIIVQKSHSPLNISTITHTVEAVMDKCDPFDHQKLPVTDLMTTSNRIDNRRVRLSPPPLVGLSPPPLVGLSPPSLAGPYFRRPSFPFSLYYPSQSHSSKKSPYKRPRSNPLSMPGDTEYYPSIAQSYRRRRSTTPPFKDYKQGVSKRMLHAPPKSINEIWSIPREVQIASLRKFSVDRVE